MKFNIDSFKICQLSFDNDSESEHNNFNEYMVYVCQKAHFPVSTQKMLYINLIYINYIY